jgi:hypothetical protein
MKPELRPVVAVVATLALVLLLGLVPTRAPSISAVSVSGTRALACTAGDETILSTTIKGAAADGVTARSLAESSQPMSAATLLSTAAPQPLVLRGSASLGGVSVSSTAAGEYRGLWLAPCVAPTAEQWFPGVMSSPTERTAVQLMNIDQAQAIVDVAIFGRDGRIVAPGARGLTVPGNTIRVLYLEPLLTTADPVGVQVRASQGRVAATVRLSGQTGGDWAVAAAPPATNQVVPLVPGGDGSRTLVVTNPGLRRASVTVEVLDTTNAFAPAGADTFEVNAESTVAIPLEAALRGSTVGLRVTSTQPVTSGVRIGTASDIALIGSTNRLASPAQVPLIGGSELLVTNGGGTRATVTLITRTADGIVVDTSRTDIEPNRSMPLPLTGDRTATFELTSDNIDVRAAVVTRTIGTVTGIAVLPLGGAGVRAASFDPVLDPGITRN